jgi:hypothetical protein
MGKLIPTKPTVIPVKNPNTKGMENKIIQMFIPISENN